MSEVKLLPLPKVLFNVNIEAATYARANVAHATAAKDAEIEALRAEVESANGWNERVSVCRDHVADIVDGPCVICALDAAEARAERLAEALRELRNHTSVNSYQIALIDAALEQENDDA